jgi:osmotically-inducible protein OsmY
LVALFLLFLMAVMASPAAASVRADEARFDDRDITTAIDAECWLDDAIDANALDVHTQDGVVTFKGTVDNILAKERASEIASNVRGVRAVVNRLRVIPSAKVDDVKLRRDVEQALLNDPATDSYEVDVEVSSGVVTLSGTVDSWQERRLSEFVAKGVRGVRDLKSNLEVHYKTSRRDYEVQQDIEGRLENDLRVDDYLIDVAVTDGRVALSGRVGSLAERNRAVSDAWVAGVQSVDGDGLIVDWFARDDMRRKTIYVSRTDEQIEQAVRDAFLYDPRVVSFEPDVKVDSGKITLSGVVASADAKRAAEADARNVVGVWSVENHLKVRPDEIPADGELERRVRVKLGTDPYVDHLDVKVSAHEGTVYLRGDVNNSFERFRAGRVAEGVKGATSVVNQLDFEYVWSWKSDREIRRDVRDQLFWSPYVDADEVSVSVDEGIVSLTGLVDTWSERDMAEKNAWDGGAKDVRNRLGVSFHAYGPHPPSHTYRYGPPYSFDPFPPPL